MVGNGNSGSEPRNTWETRYRVMAVEWFPGLKQQLSEGQSPILGRRVASGLSVEVESSFCKKVDATGSDVGFATVRGQRFNNNNKPTQSISFNCQPASVESVLKYPSPFGDYHLQGGSSLICG